MLFGLPVKSGLWQTTSFNILPSPHKAHINNNNKKKEELKAKLRLSICISLKKKSVLANSNYHEKYPSWNKHDHCSSTCIELKLWGPIKEKTNKKNKISFFLELKKAASILNKGLLDVCKYNNK